MTGRWKKKCGILLGTVLILAGMACVVQTGPKALEKRVTAFWHAREAGRYTFKYGGKQVDLYNDFLSEKTKRELTQQQYYGLMSLKISNPRIDGIEYDKNGKKATVTIRFDTTFQIAKLNGVAIKQTWIVENGKWVLQSNPMHNPFRSW
ncbi:MAG: hypothetical protein GXO69_09615 [Acidobacteria bacterium]|nr:hypothetical protein [Acidobacteriota bacterium]